jgi:glucose-1-phosphate adenylyltransferase
VRVETGAVIRNSVILTDAIIHSGAVIENSIIDKRVEVYDNARVGSPFLEDDIQIAMVGKNSQIPASIVVESGAIIATDLIPSDYPSTIIRSGDYLQTKRLPYEV